MSELKHFLRQRWEELLIAGIWLQAVIAAAFTGNWVVFVVAVLGGMALIVAVFVSIGWWKRRNIPIYGENEAFSVPRRALVFTVGGQQHTIQFALKGQQPQWLGLICSKGTEPIADGIIAVSGLPEDHIQKEVVDPWNVVDIRRQMSSILDWLHFHQVAADEIAVDITGGTTIMSVAAFSAAAERQIDCQYVRSDFDADNKPIARTQRGVFVTRSTRVSAIKTSPVNILSD